MKLSKFVVFGVAVAMSFGAFADAADTLITFSTPGPDKYADGKVVEDGEVYALVWSKDGVFEGFTAKGEATDTNDKVIFKANLAKDGHCGLTLFQIDSKDAPQGGEYAVYLLDTRAGEGRITGAALAKTFLGTSGGMDNIANADVDKTVDGEGNPVAIETSIAALTGDTKAIAPSITGIKVDGAAVKITVDNILPGLVYNVRGGLDGKADLSGTKSEPIGKNKVEFTVDAGDENFFKVFAN